MIKVRVYIDYIFMINFMFDFLILLCVSLALRRNIMFRRIIIGSIIGSLTTFLLFLNITGFELFVFKVIVSIFMCLVTFGYKNFLYTFKNILFLYFISMFLGGALYCLNIEFSYYHEGLIFYHKGISINVIVLIILSPIIIYLYIKQILDLKVNYSSYYKVDIVYKNKRVKLNGFLDTGNKLVDPISRKPVIVVEENKFRDIDSFTIIPFSTINDSSLIKCIKPDSIYINNIKYNKSVRVGLVKKIEMEGVGCILNPIIIGDIC